MKVDDEESRQLLRERLEKPPRKSWKRWKRPSFSDKQKVKQEREMIRRYGAECEICGASMIVPVIHHRNTNPADNRIENIMPVCWPCHRHLHAKFANFNLLKDHEIKTIINEGLKVLGAEDCCKGENCDAYQMKCWKLNEPHIQKKCFELQDENKKLRWSLAKTEVELEMKLKYVARLKKRLNELKKQLCFHHETPSKSGESDSASGENEIFKEGYINLTDSLI